MHKSGKNTSLESIEWLEYCNREYSINPDMAGIQHAFTALGEKRIGNYYLDGYAEWLEGEDDDIEHIKIGYEFNGCRYHRCKFKCDVVCIQTDEQYEMQKKKEAYLKTVLTSLKVIQSCEWEKQKQAFRRQGLKIESKSIPFLTRKFVSEYEILKSIQNGDFYGICKADIETPKDVAEKYRKLNFPLIFHHVEVTEDMLHPDMLEKAKAKGRKFPQTQKTLSWNAKEYIGCTPLLRFYMNLGMKVTNIQWALNYQRGKPFKGFVAELVEERIRASQAIPEDKPRGDRAKFVLNSAVGKLIKLKVIMNEVLKLMIT